MTCYNKYSKPQPWLSDPLKFRGEDEPSPSETLEKVKGILKLFISRVI